MNYFEIEIVLGRAEHEIGLIWGLRMNFLLEWRCIFRYDFLYIDNIFLIYLFLNLLL